MPHILIVALVDLRKCFFQIDTSVFERVEYFFSVHLSNLSAKHSMGRCTPFANFDALWAGVLARLAGTSQTTTCCVSEQRIFVFGKFEIFVVYCVHPSPHNVGYGDLCWTSAFAAIADLLAVTHSIKFRVLFKKMIINC